MKSRSTLLLQRALYLLERDPIFGIEVDLIDRNVHAWRVTLSGLDDSDWAGAQLIVDLQFPDSFDLDPPIVKFLTVPYHPNVRPNDGVLVCALLQFWVSGTDIPALLVAIQNLLSEPMVNDPCPANYAAASLYVNDQATYSNIVREMAYSAPIALQQLRLETHFAHTTQIFLNAFAEKAQSRAPTRPGSSAPTTQPVPAPGPSGLPRVTVSHDTHVTLKRHQPCRPRVRKLLFESYYSDWQSLATTVPGNNCRVEFSSEPSAPTGTSVATSTSPRRQVQLSRIPTGQQIASIVGTRNKNQVLVNLKAGMTPQALAMHVYREDAVRASRQEHLLRHGSLATTIPPPVPDGDPTTGKVWLVPTDASSNPKSNRSPNSTEVSASPSGIPPMTFMVVGGPPVATTNAVSLALPSSGGVLGNLNTSQHILYADHHNKDPSFRVRDRIAGRVAPRRSTLTTNDQSVRQDDMARYGIGNSRPGSTGSNSTRTYTRGSSALDRWTPSPVDARARLAVKVVSGMPVLDGSAKGQDSMDKGTLPPLPKLVVLGDDDEVGMGSEKIRDNEDIDLEVLSWAKDLPLDVV